MIISDLNYLEYITETSCVDISGGRRATAISAFSGLAVGDSTYTSASVQNLSSTNPSDSSFAKSSVKVLASASGNNVLVNTTAISYASVG